MFRRPVIDARLLRLAAAAGAAVCLAAPTLALAKPIGTYTTKGAWSFVSAPDLHPPKLSTTTRTSAARLAPGDFLTANFPNLVATAPPKGPGLEMIGQSGPLILDRHLAPVWFQPVPTNVVASDLQQETFAGKPVLVWWQGVVTNTGATKSGEVVVVDQRYQPLAALQAKAPWVISLHDAVISGADIWVTVYRYVKGVRLKSYGGPRSGTVLDSGVQEYALKTGRLLYTWDALKHIPLRQSEQPAPKSARVPWDAYHVNSLQVIGSAVFVSMRNTWAAYFIDPATGSIVWTLGGRASTFTLGRKARFAWQHNVQLLPGGEISLFDDECCRLEPSGSFAAPNGSSRGLILRLDLVKRRATVVAAYPHRPALAVAFLGSMQLLPGGNAVVGWGSQPYFSEYSRSGRTLLDALWPGPDQSYRALYTQTWVGTPAYPPSGAARRVRGATTIYASWNGATQVVSWQVVGGRRAAHLSPVGGRRPRSGFETAIGLGKSTYGFFKVRAFDADGRLLGTSRPFSVR